MGAHGLGAAARGQGRGAQLARLPRCEHRAGHAALAQGGQGRLCRAAAVDHHGRHAGAGCGLEGGVPPLVDLHQVDQGAHHAVDLAEELAPACPLEVGEGPLERLCTRRRPVLRIGRLVRLGLHDLGAAGGGLELSGARRQLRGESGRGLLEVVGGPGRQIGLHGGSRVPLLERGEPGPERVDVLALPGGRARHQVGAGPGARHGLFGIGDAPE